VHVADSLCFVALQGRTVPFQKHKLHSLPEKELDAGVTVQIPGQRGQGMGKAEMHDVTSGGLDHLGMGTDLTPCTIESSSTTNTYPHAQHCLASAPHQGLLRRLHKVWKGDVGCSRYLAATATWGVMPPAPFPAASASEYFLMS
jgi:hypothetical protein